MPRAKLTALAVERAHRSGDRVLLNDGDGLYLRKQTRDGASWTLRYQFAGREHWLTLGHYPDMSLAQARIEARQARVLLDKQQDPLTARRAAEAEQRQRGSFRALCEDWYRNEITGRGLKHPEVARRHLDKYLLPKLGRTGASDVTPADVARVIDEVKGPAPTAANDLLRFTRRIFAFGVRRRMVPSNPAADFSPRLDGGGIERPRSRALSPDELAKLVQKIRENCSRSAGAIAASACRMLDAIRSMPHCSACGTDSHPSLCTTCVAPRALNSQHSASGARWPSAAWGTRSVAWRAHTIVTTTSRSAAPRSSSGPVC